MPPHRLRLHSPSFILFIPMPLTQEVRPDRVKRTIIVVEKSIKVEFAGEEPKFLRVAASSLLNTMALATQTAAEFSS